MIIKKQDRKRINNSPKCTVYEYPFDEKDINVAYVEINGRYPDQGFALNKIVKGMVFVTSGSGTIVIDNEEYQLEEGDMVLIKSNQKYFFEGKLKLVMSCTPAWSPYQYENV